MKKTVMNRSVFGIVVIALIVGLVFSVLASVTFGNADISVKEVYQVILYELFHVESLSSYAEGAVHDVVWLIRLPRVLLAVGVGMGLSVCGVVMQAVVKNPLADPYVLGVSSGGYLGAAAAVLLGFGSAFGDNSMGIMAFIGAMAASFAVLFISGVGGRSNAGKLILAGMAISSVCSAFANFLIYISQNRDATAQISYWSMGSLAAADWNNVPVLLPIMLIASLIFWTQSRNLNLMLLGDETAITLGTDLHRARMVYMILSSLMVGFAVCAAGMIGFVGLIIPHTVRMVFGTEHRRLVPVSALIGAVFLIWADVTCRVILPNSELPIGILVSLIGAPCFIYLMVRRSYGFGGKGT